MVPVVRKPNWEVWGNVPNVEVWEGVALSLDIEPRKVRMSQDGWMGGPGSFAHLEGESFADRLEVVCRNLTGPNALPLAGIVMGEPHYCKVPIAAFARFAISKRWAIPDPLAELASQGEALSPTPAEKVDLTTTERQSLLKLVIGMATQAYKYDPAAARSAVLPEIVSDLEAAGVALEADTVRKYLKEAADLLPGGKAKRRP